MVSTEYTVTIDPEDYNSQDIDLLSDMIVDIIAERYGHVCGTLSFTIAVTYTEAPDGEDEEMAE